MITTHAYDPAARQRSYELLARAFGDNRQIALDTAEGPD